MASVQESIEVPVSTAYNQWTQFEQSPGIETGEWRSAAGQREADDSPADAENQEPR